MTRERKPKIGEMEDGILCSWNESGKCTDLSGDVKCGIWEKKDCSEWTDQKIPKSRRRKKK